MSLIFTENKDGTYNCLSDSGSNYRITENTCNCLGFQYRKTCRHFKEAKQKGLLEKLRLATAIKTNANPHFHLRSPFIISSRKKAIAEWFQKHKMGYTQVIVDKIEKIMAIETPMEYCLERIKYGKES